MKYAWLILSYTVTLVSSQENRVGDLYLAEKPYIDWFSTDACSAHKGKPCNMGYCSGSRYANNVCCCDVQLDRIPPGKPVYMITDASDQAATMPVQQPAPACKVQQPDDKTMRQTLFDKIKSCLGLGS